MVISYSAEELVDDLCALPQNSVVYAYNLRFDYAAIFRNLWEREDIELEEKICGMQKKVFQVAIKRKLKRIYLRDAAPLFGSTARTLDNVLKSWTTGWEKPKIEYYVDRPSEVSAEFMHYFEVDIYGFSEALENRFEIGRGKPKMTAPSEAKEAVRECINEENPRVKDYFNNVAFPALSKEEDRAMRPYYRGGYVWVNPQYEDDIINKIKVFDKNSMYPSIMRDLPLPWRKAEYFEGEPPLEGLFCVCIEVDWAEVKGDWPPFLTNKSIRTAKGAAEYLNVVNPEMEDRRFYLTNMELEIFLNAYNYGGLTYHGGFSFRASTRNFTGFVEKYRLLKENSTGAMREYAKLVLNSPSGKWGENPIQMTYHSELENGVQKYKPNPPEHNEPFYLPVSIFITAYARMELVKRIHNMGIDNFVYCDTDSLHVLSGQPSDIDAHKLGFWKLEKVADRAKYVGCKRYCLEFDGELSFTCAGIPQKAFDAAGTTLEGFRKGLLIECERMRMAEGGQRMQKMNISV